MAISCDTAKAGVDSGRGLEGRRAVFLSVQGGQSIDMSYVIPLKHTGKN